MGCGLDSRGQSRRMRFLAAPLFALAFAACTPTEDESETVLTSEPDSRLISDEDRACAVDDECTLIDETCCPCISNGGTEGRTAVATSAVDAIDARRAATCSGGACATAVSTNDTCCASTAVCVAGRCEVNGVAGRTLLTNCE